jgi:hypothetical protein
MCSGFEERFTLGTGQTGMARNHFKTYLRPDGCVKTLLKILTYQIRMLRFFVGLCLALEPDLRL